MCWLLSWTLARDKQMRYLSIVANFPGRPKVCNSRLVKRKMSLMVSHTPTWMCISSTDALDRLDSGLMQKLESFYSQLEKWAHMESTEPGKVSGHKGGLRDVKASWRETNCHVLQGSGHRGWNRTQTQMQTKMSSALHLSLSADLNPVVELYYSEITSKKYIC